MGDFMKDSFLKVAAITPDIRVGDTEYNTNHIIKKMKEADNKNVKLAVFPELCITGYTCSDLFLQDILLKGALSGLAKICKASQNIDMLTIVGLPFMHCGRLYNTAAVVHKGELLGLVPKQHIPNYSEFYEARHFVGASDNETALIYIDELGEEFIDYDDYVDFSPKPFSPKLLFQAENMPELIIGVEICEDLWMPIPPSSNHAMASATVIANLSASDETTGKDIYRK